MLIINKMKKIIILDYGAGNVKSVYNISRYIGNEVLISNTIKDIQSSSHIILPGVGSFKSSINKIKEKLPIDEIIHEIKNKQKPILGICVGMQILADIGYEFEMCEGLGLIPGKVEKLFTNNLPLPHIGWNNVEIKKKNPLFLDLDQENSFYFVHSYSFVPKDKKNIIGSTDYENVFVSAIQHENIFGVQFHPEKSQKSGIKLLKNFFKI